MGWGGSGRQAQEGRTYIYLWLIHADVWQKPLQLCKAIILQLKKVKKKSLNDRMPVGRNGKVGEKMRSKMRCWGFPVGPGVKNLPPDAGDEGSIPSWEAKILHVCRNSGVKGSCMK